MHFSKLKLEIFFIANQIKFTSKFSNKTEQRGDKVMFCSAGVLQDDVSPLPPSTFT